MSRIVSVTQKAAAGAKRIFDILDHVSNVPDPAQPVKLAQVQGSIAMRSVGFRYGSRAVIRNLERLGLAPSAPQTESRLEVLEREHQEFFERWHAERRKREELEDAIRDIFPAAHRLALELECLLLDTKDTAAVSKWWDSANEALEQWREFCREETHNAEAQPRP